MSNDPSDSTHCRSELVQIVGFGINFMIVFPHSTRVALLFVMQQFTERQVCAFDIQPDFTHSVRNVRLTTPVYILDRKETL